MMGRGRIRMEDFITGGCGGVERDRWVTSMILLCRAVSGDDDPSAILDRLGMDAVESWEL